MSEDYLHNIIRRGPTPGVVQVPTTVWKRNIESIYKHASKPQLIKGEFIIPYTSELAPAFWMFLQACSMVQPPCLDHTACRRKGDQMFVTLRQPYTEMPIEAIRTEVDRLREHMVDHFTTIRAKDEGKLCVIQNSAGMPLNVVMFANLFTTDPTKALPLYALPPGATFTDSKGMMYTDKDHADERVMLEFLNDHTYPGLPNNDLAQLSPVALVVEPEQLDRMIAALDIRIGKADGLVGMKPQGRA